MKTKSAQVIPIHTAGLTRLFLLVDKYHFGDRLWCIPKNRVRRSKAKGHLIATRRLGRTGKANPIRLIRVKRIRENLLLFALPVLVLLTGCGRQNEVTPTPATPAPASPNQSQTDNDWILENMRTYYYWNTQIPASPDRSLSPEAFFNSLLYAYEPTRRPDGDRFSYLEENAQALEAALSGQEQTTGAEFTLYRVSQNASGVIAQVLYVLPGSPAERAGIRRGNIIYRVNGQGLTTENYFSLLFEQSAQQWELARWQNNQLVPLDQTIMLTTAVLQENPVFLDSVYTVGASRVGYLVYNQFIPGPNGSTTDTYDQQVDAVFASFQAAGISELILDLRYNPGGYVSSATNLASLIGSGVDASRVFYRQEWNQAISAQLEEEYGADFFEERFTAKSQNIGNQINRVYVLTSGQTASASELIINGLRPYMQVITIGTTTVGKNVGSITISDETGEVNWALQPIVFKSFNSLGQSDYEAGFAPAVEVQESIDLRPLGDVEEALLGAALAPISGRPAARRGSTTPDLPVAGSSLVRKAGGGNMFDNRVNIR